MLKNLLLSSIRNIKRNIFNTTIGLISLVVGILSFITIIKYNSYEFSYDSFNKNINNIYRLNDDFSNSSGSFKRARTFHALHQGVQQIAGVANSAQCAPVTTEASIKVGDQIFSENNLNFTSPSLFEILDIDLILGSVEDLQDPNAVFLSQSMALKYFGKTDPLGKEIEMRNIQGNDYTAHVAGVFKEIPSNSHIRADIFLSIFWLNNATNEGLIFGPTMDLDAVTWRWTNFYTYVQLTDGANVPTVEKRIQDFVDIHRAELNKGLNQKHDIYLQPLSKIHTTSGIQYEFSKTVNKALLNIFYLVAFLILIIAWFNYTNLTIAQTMNRTKEVGIRKVLGSSKFILIGQFLLESIILNLTALLISYLIIFVFESQLEAIMGKPIFLAFWSNITLHLIIVSVIIFGAILAGLYPSLGLTNYKPMDTIHGKLKRSSECAFLRKVLISPQFVIATFVISVLLIIQSQFNFLIDHDLGIDIDNVISLRSPGASQSTESREKIDTFLDRLEASPNIEKVSLSSVLPGTSINWIHSASIIGSPSNEGILLNRGLINHSFLDLYGLKLLSGRLYNEENRGDRLVTILNRKAVTELGFNVNDILGEKISFPGNQNFEVIGVIDDFYQKGTQFQHESFALQLDTANAGAYISIKYLNNKAEEAMLDIEKNFKATFPDDVFSYSFIDDVFKNQYSEDQKFRNIILIFTTIIILISALGILGLSTYIVNQKMKEICIRKVLGAKLSTLFLFLNREYLILLFISFCISCPLVLYFMTSWLENYANKVSIELWMLILPLAITLILIIGITIRNTLKALLVNPARILRED